MIMILKLHDYQMRVTISNLLIDHSLIIKIVYSVFISRCRYSNNTSISCTLNPNSPQTNHLSLSFHLHAFHINTRNAIVCVEPKFITKKLSLSLSLFSLVRLSYYTRNAIACVERKDNTTNRISPSRFICTPFVIIPEMHCGAQHTTHPVSGCNVNNRFVSLPLTPPHAITSEGGNSGSGSGIGGGSGGIWKPYSAM